MEVCMYVGGMSQLTNKTRRCDAQEGKLITTAIAYK